MEFQIKSRKLNQTLTFSIPGSGNIYVDTNGKPGTLGEQIRKDSGSCISYRGDDQLAFEAICRKWYRKALPDMLAHKE